MNSHIQKPILLDLPNEIMQIIVNYINPNDHDALTKTCKYFYDEIYHLVTQIEFTPKTIKYWSRYKNLNTISFYNCIPKESKVKHEKTKTVYINFTAPNRRRCDHNIDFGRLFRWVSNLKIQELDCNIEITKYHLPLILSCETLKSLHHEFLLSGSLPFLNTEIEYLSVVIVRSNEFLDLSRFHALKFFRLWGILSTNVYKTLKSCPSLQKIDITLLGIDNNIPIENLNIYKLDLSGYRGNLFSAFCKIPTLKYVVFPPQVQKDHMIPFLNRDIYARIADFEGVNFGIIDKGTAYTSIGNLINSR